MLNTHETDILVIGTGIAGGSAAITAADLGAKVTIVSKGADLYSGNTSMAQGGIIFKGITDKPDKLAADILSAGDGLCHEPAVRELAEKAPPLVEEFLIKRLGIHFDLNGSGELDLTEEGAHSEPRIVHFKDKTGQAIQDGINAALTKHPNITVLLEHSAIDILTYSHHSENPLDIYRQPEAFGAWVLNIHKGQVMPIFAKKVILATGGLGAIYMHTSNPAVARGDGIAMAYRAGARLLNLQYVQFHPTTMLHSKGRFLISESLRGEGGILVDWDGHEFMWKLHPKGHLAPRDVVARGIHQAMFDSHHHCVYLDISHKPAQWLKDRFPGIYQACLDRNCDITKEAIPVVPAAHYACGGVQTDLSGNTNIARLFAVGEVACTGVHGANRLASTSLLEGLLWGKRAGEEACQFNAGEGEFPEIRPWEYLSAEIDLALILQDWQTIRSTMWNYVGLVRTRQRMHRARDILRNLQSDVERFYRKARITDPIIGLRNGLQTAIAIIHATLESRESRGTHYVQQ